MKDIHQVYLGLGTNLGDKNENLDKAINKIEKRIGNLIACSAFYTTAPVGFDSENDFLNTTCHIQSELSAWEILKRTQTIEKEMGRSKKSINFTYADRMIDIDILFYDDLIIETPSLTIPHPFLHNRLFVLNPLAEIADGLIHPTLNKTIRELRNELIVMEENL